ncbi:MAG: ABC transporter ATP-binding protein [Pseudomonadota bacterium]
MSTPTPTPRLEAVNLSLARGERTLAETLALPLYPGQCWALLGQNGAGKTTLLHALAGILAPGAGMVRLDGADIRALPARVRARRLGLLTQDASEGFEETVLEAALAGRHPHIDRFAGESDRDREIAVAALRRCGLAGFETRRVQSLSGGERRRLALATLLTQNPNVLLLDEPLNHLDLKWQGCLLHQLRARADEGGLVLLSLHDPNLALRHCTHALTLDGRGGWQAGEVDTVLSAETLSRLYGVPMRALHDGQTRWMVPDTPPAPHA